MYDLNILYLFSQRPTSQYSALKERRETVDKALETAEDVTMTMASRLVNTCKDYMYIHDNVNMLFDLVGLGV